MATYPADFIPRKHDVAVSGITSTPSTKGAVKEVDAKITEWMKEAEGSIPETNWRMVSVEDYNFYAGKQDTADVLQLLAEQKRPPSVFNTILPKINMLCGLAAQSNRVPYIFQVSAEDDALTELMNNTFKHYRNKIGLNEKENDCFDHLAKSGRSFLYFYLSKDDPSKPQIKAKRLPGRSVLIDPLSVEYDLSDARYVFIDQWFQKDDILAYWPNFPADAIKSLSSSMNSEPVFYNSVSDKYRITECWYRKYEKRVYFVNPLTGQQEDVSLKEFSKFTALLQKGITLPNGQVIQYTDPIPNQVALAKRVYYSVFSAQYELEGGPTPYRFQYFPIVLYGAYRDENENRWFGVITMMKDPQRARNVMRRQLVHLLQTSPKGILEHEVGAIVNEDEYDKKSSEPGFRLIINKGYMDKVRHSSQPQISPVYNHLDAQFEQDEKDVSGVQDPLLGIQTSSREPGITVRMRQETGIAVLYILFSNFRKSRILGGKILLALIQQFVTAPEVIRIQGQEGAMLMQINSQKNPQASNFNDISVGEYDLVIDETVENTTMRMVIAQMLIDFAQSNPGSIPPDLIMEYSDMPFSAKQRVSQYHQMMMEREDARFRAELEAKGISEAMSNATKVHATNAKSKVAKPSESKEK